MTQLCRRCRFHPASARIAGYCSWDCHDADDAVDAEDVVSTDDDADPVDGVGDRRHAPTDGQQEDTAVRVGRADAITGARSGPDSDGHPAGRRRGRPLGSCARSCG